MMDRATLFPRWRSRITKRYDTARTPYRRVLDLPQIPQGTKHAVTQTYRSLNPAELKRAIGLCQDRLSP